MLVRIALFLIAVWVALQLLKIFLGGLVHLLIIAAVIFLIIKVLDRGRKTEM